MQTTDEVRFLKPLPQIWSDALRVLAETLRPSGLAWVQQAELRHFGDGVAVIAVCNGFSQTMTLPYKSLIQEALKRVTGIMVAIEFIVDSSVGNGSYTGTFTSIVEQAPVDMTPQAMPTQTVNETPSFIEDQPYLMGDSTEDISPKALMMSNVAPMPAPAFNAQAARTAMPPQTGRFPSNPVPRPAAPRPDRSGLNGKYAFSNFVVGSNNRFCHSAALAVAASPGQNYNPLFIYGGVGLGKTHLMQAIGNAILQSAPETQIRYLSCERFTNDLINSIKDKSMTEFRKRYRQIDVLMIDDIQFIEGKESTQEEFFHTFNALKEMGKQLVISSDRPPKALSKLEERLRSRFECGLIADIQAPDYETRLAILRKKCELDGIRIDDSAMNQIATIFSSNIRELEGALIRVNAYASLTGERVDQMSLHTLLSPGGVPVTKPQLTVEGILAVVAAHYRIEPSELKSSKRSADLTLPRHIAMHLAHDLMNLSLPRIGAAFGNRKHTSALYAINKVKELIDKDPTVTATIAQIRHQLGH